jgi:hypothetical protein
MVQNLNNMFISSYQTGNNPNSLISIDDYYSADTSVIEMFFVLAPVTNILNHRHQE